MTLLEVIVGIIVGIGGIYVAIHNTRRRARRAVHREIDDLTSEISELNAQVHALRVLLLEQRRYIYNIVMTMIDAGMDPPQPPDPSFDRDEYKDEF